MSYLTGTRDHLTDLVEEVITVGGEPDTAQTVTIGRPRAEVEQFWHDPDNLSQVLGDIASIRVLGDGIHEWHTHRGPEQTLTWRTTLHDADGAISFTAIREDGTPAEDRPRVDLRFRDAPHDLGTEVTLRVRTAVPELLTRAAIFKALYRARALIQTGEIPTLDTPSARATAC